MKACAKVCWCTQGIWTMISEPSVREPKASDAPCMSASVCNVKVFLHFHLFTNHASLRLPQRRDWLCYACPLSPAVCVNAQGYKHTEKKNPVHCGSIWCSTTGRRTLRNSRHATTKSDWTGSMTSMGIPKRSLLRGDLSIDLHISTLVVL